MKRLSAVVVCVVSFCVASRASLEGAEKSLPRERSIRVVAAVPLDSIYVSQKGLAAMAPNMNARFCREHQVQ